MEQWAVRVRAVKALGVGSNGVEDVAVKFLTVSVAGAVGNGGMGVVEVAAVGFGTV